MTPRPTLLFETSPMIGQFGWDGIATIIAAVLAAAVAVCGYAIQQRMARRERRAAIYSEALRAVEDYLEAPYLVRRRDGSAANRQAITTHISDVQSRLAYHRALLEIHATPRSTPPTTHSSQPRLRFRARDRTERVDTDRAARHLTANEFVATHHLDQVFIQRAVQPPDELSLERLLLLEVQRRLPRNPGVQQTAEPSPNPCALILFEGPLGILPCHIPFMVTSGHNTLWPVVRVQGPQRLAYLVPFLDAD